MFDVQTDELGFTTRHVLHLKGPFVHEATGVTTSTPLLPDDKLRTTKLVPFVKNTRAPEEMPEFAEIELLCPKVTVRTVKKAGRSSARTGTPVRAP